MSKEESRGEEANFLHSRISHKCWLYPKTPSSPVLSVCGDLILHRLFTPACRGSWWLWGILQMISGWSGWMWSWWYWPLSSSPGHCDTVRILSQEQGYFSNQTVGRLILYEGDASFRGLLVSNLLMLLVKMQMSSLPPASPQEPSGAEGPVCSERQKDQESVFFLIEKYLRWFSQLLLKLESDAKEAAILAKSVLDSLFPGMVRSFCHLWTW